MINKVRAAYERYEEIGALLGGGEVSPGSPRYKELMKEYSGLSPLCALYGDYLAAERSEEEAKEFINSKDDELSALAKEEEHRAKAEKERTIKEMKTLLLPRDPLDDKNVVIELRACAGGEEAALFAADLFRMYGMFCDRMGFKVEKIAQNQTELGGYRQIDFLISGKGAYGYFRFESGVHRVQRVPRTESQGRIQTSTVSCAVLPEADEIEVSIEPSDLVFESMKSSGAGGQHINKTESAVRLTHKPTGIVVECDEERSQFKNKDKALKLLRAKLYDIESTKQDEAISGARREQVGTGDRSEKIRTYNFPQGRVTDHRIGLTLYTLEDQMNGDLLPILERLREEDAAKKLTAGDGSFGEE